MTTPIQKAISSRLKYTPHYLDKNMVKGDSYKKGQTSYHEGTKESLHEKMERNFPSHKGQKGYKLTIHK